MRPIATRSTAPLDDGVRRASQFSMDRSCSGSIWVIRDAQQSPREQTKPEEPCDARSAHRRAVADHAEEDARSYDDRNSKERRKQEAAPFWEPSEGEREQRRHQKEEFRRDAGFDPVPVGLP